MIIAGPQGRPSAFRPTCFPLNSAWDELQPVWQPRKRRTEWENSEEDIRKTSASDQEGIEVSLPFETAKNLDKMHKIQFPTLDFRLHRIVIPERRVRRCPCLPHLAIWRECPGHRAGRGPRQSPAGAKI